MSNVQRTLLLRNAPTTLASGPIASAPRARSSKRTARLRLVAFVSVSALAAVGGGACIVHTDESSPVVETDVYEPCAVDADCPGGTACWVVDMQYDDGYVEDAMCTTPCYDDLDCPGSGICEYAGGDPPLCYQPCVGDLDCPFGFACVADAYEVGAAPICVPF